jgi:hypothetical protein
MKAYPPDDECFVKRQTSVKDWPVFSDNGRLIRPVRAPEFWTRSSAGDHVD